MKPTVVTTFAGMGGSSYGYKRAGFEVLLASEWDPHAAETYRLNHPSTHLVHGDIHDLSAEHVLEVTGLKRGELTVFDGSPPCQGFSTAGNRDLNDPRNQLFREYVRLLRGLAPRAFVMENVKGMSSGRMKPEFQKILLALEESDYEVRAWLLNAADYEVGSARPRIIIVGFRRDLGLVPSPPPMASRRTPLRDLVPGAKWSASLINPSWFKSCSFEKTKNGTAPAKRVQFAGQAIPATRSAPTITKTSPPVVGFVGGEVRHMTPEECLRISSFPEDVKFPEGSTDRQKTARIGNAVPPNLMKHVAFQVRRQLGM